MGQAMRTCAVFAVLFASGLGCSTRSPSHTDLAPTYYIGCYAFVATADSMIASADGGLGDSLASAFHIELLNRTVNTDSNPDPAVRGIPLLAAYWPLFEGIGGAGWRVSADTLTIVGQMYGWDSWFELVGAPTRLTGWAVVRTHRGFREHAQLIANKVPCK